MKYYILSFAALLFSCGGAHVDPHAGHDHSSQEEHPAQEAHAEATKAEEAHGAGDEIVLTPSQLATYNIQAQEVKLSAFSEVIHTSGRIMPATGDVAMVVSSTEGIVTIENRSLSLNSSVAKGQTIFTISSRTLPQGEQSVRTEAAYTTAKKEYERAKELAVDKIMSQKELEQAELNYKNARAAYDAQKNNVSTNGITLKAPIAGFVTSLDVQNGSYVNVGAPLATISQNKQLVIRADVPARYFQQLASIKSANFRSAHNDRLYSTTELNGHKIASSNNLNSGSNYLNVDFQVDNRGELLSGSLLDVFLVGSTDRQVIAIPQTAILEQQGHNYVMIRLDEECFERREVQLGASNGQLSEIVGGLKIGENVVVNGAYQVNMAAVSTAIPEGHTH